jgi:hypothetical protein
MKYFLKYIKELVILALIIILGLSWTNKSDTPEPIIKTVTETEYISSPPDTIQVDTIIYKTKVKWRTQEIPQDVDTSAILEDYFSKYYYSEVIDLDSLGTLTINDTITQNKIYSRNYITNFKFPHTTTTTTITKFHPKRNLISLGITGGFLSNPNIQTVNFNLGPALNFLDKGRKNNFNINYNLFNKEVNFSYTKYLIVVGNK